MKINPEKRKVLEDLYVEILHDQNYYMSIANSTAGALLLFGFS